MIEDFKFCSEKEERSSLFSLRGLDAGLYHMYSVQKRLYLVQCLLVYVSVRRSCTWTCSPVGNGPAPPFLSWSCGHFHESLARIESLLPDPVLRGLAMCPEHVVRNLEAVRSLLLSHSLFLQSSFLLINMTDTEKDCMQAGCPTETPSSISTAHEPPEPIVTLKTWIVSSV